MANAKRDGNDKPTVLCTLQSDGQTTVNIQVNPANNSLAIIDGTSGTASTRLTAPTDENGVSAWMGVSSADGVTPVPIACDSNGTLLVQST